MTGGGEKNTSSPYPTPEKDERRRKREKMNKILKEIHEVMEKIYEETKNLSNEGKIKREAEEVIKKRGLKIRKR